MASVAFALQNEWNPWHLPSSLRMREGSPGLCGRRARQGGREAGREGQGGTGRAAPYRGGRSTRVSTGEAVRVGGTDGDAQFGSGPSESRAAGGVKPEALIPASDAAPVAGALGGVITDQLNLKSYSDSDRRHDCRHGAPAASPRPGPPPP